MKIKQSFISLYVRESDEKELLGIKRICAWKDQYSLNEIDITPKS